MAKVLIAGCGDLGSGVAAELVKNGHEVTGIRRTKAQFPEGVVGMTGDLLSMTDDNLPDVDVVFLIMTPNGRDEDAYRAAYFDTAQVLIRRYKAMVKPPQVFLCPAPVYTDNIKVSGLMKLRPPSLHQQRRQYCLKPSRRLLPYCPV